MLFRFTQAQWEGVGRCIERVGGAPSDWVKEELEDYVNRVFLRKNLRKQQAILFRRVYAAATDLADALKHLAEISRFEAEADKILSDEIIFSDVKQRLKFAKNVQQYADGAYWMLEKGFQLDDEPTRGRPVDSSLPAFVSQVFELGRQDKWILEDKKGFTSPRFIDLLVELASCARSAGLDHSRDIRRALIRAVAAARVEEEEWIRNRHNFDEFLNDLAFSAQKKAGA